MRLFKINQSGYISHQGFYQTCALLDLSQICFTWPSCFNQIFLSNMGTLVNNNKRWKFFNFWSLCHLSWFCLEYYTLDAEHEYPVSSDSDRQKNFYTLKKIFTGSGACRRRHKIRKPLLQMTNFWLYYLAIAIDNLYIHELLGYMRCLFLFFSSYIIKLYSLSLSSIQVLCI